MTVLGMLQAVLQQVIVRPRAQAMLAGAAPDRTGWTHPTGLFSSRNRASWPPI